MRKNVELKRFKKKEKIVNQKGIFLWKFCRTSNFRRLLHKLSCSRKMILARERKYFEDVRENFTETQQLEDFRENVCRDINYLTFFGKRILFAETKFRQSLTNSRRKFFAFSANENSHFRFNPGANHINPFHRTNKGSSQGFCAVVRLGSSPASSTKGSTWLPHESSRQRAERLRERERWC